MSRYFDPQKESAKKQRFKKTKLHAENSNSKNEEISDEEVEADMLFPGNAYLKPESLKKYKRGKKLNTDGVAQGIKKHEVIKTDKIFRNSVRQAARAELLLPEEDGFLEVEDDEDTFLVTQDEISSSVDITSSTKFFTLNLTDFGPYKIHYSRDGRNLLLGGRRGHVAAVDWVTKRLLCEINVMESVHDVCWLHMPTMYAVAQKTWVHIYDNQGVELHCVKKLNNVLQMEFLPYHFLLATSSEQGFLSWLDVSIGKLITETYTNAGRLNVLCQNPNNAVVLTGHANGSVSMWSPNVKIPLVRMLCHPHPIRALAVDPKGLYMATSSIDRTLKIWDVRTYKCMQTYKIGSASGVLEFSQKGLLAAGCGNVVEVYKDCCTQASQKPYMRHKVQSTVTDFQFCPYEDVLGIGHNQGFTSILIPGAGEPNFDAYESNPFMTKAQRREMEVKSLLEKIQPELITLNSSHLGSVDIPTLKEKIEEKKALLYVKTPKIDFEPKKKTKGKGKLANVFKRKKAVIEAKKKELLKQKLKMKSKDASKQGKQTIQQYTVLDRFKPATQS